MPEWVRRAGVGNDILFGSRNHLRITGVTYARGITGNNDMGRTLERPEFTGLAANQEDYEM